MAHVVNFLIADSTLFTKIGSTVDTPFITRETVLILVSDSAATSRIVGRARLDVLFIRNYCTWLSPVIVPSNFSASNSDVGALATIFPRRSTTIRSVT